MSRLRRAAAAAGLPAAEGLREALRRRHAEVCACPFDGSDPGCNLLMDGAELAALAATDRAERGLPLDVIDVERLAEAVENVALREHTGMDRGGGVAYTTPGAATGPLDLRAIAAEYVRLAADPQSPTGEGS